MNRTPSTMSSTTFRLLSGGGELMRNEIITSSMLTQPTTPTKKTDSVPPCVMSSPPAIGVTSRENCHITEPRATALIICFRSINSGKKELRTGPSKPITSPCAEAMATRCQI